MKILTELGLYDEAFKLSQNLVRNSQTNPEQKLKIHVERALVFEINNDYSSCIKELYKAENLILKYPRLKFKTIPIFLFGNLRIIVSAVHQK